MMSVISAALKVNLGSKMLEMKAICCVVYRLEGFARYYDDLICEFHKTRKKCSLSQCFKECSGFMLVIATDNNFDMKNWVVFAVTTYYF